MAGVRLQNITKRFGTQTVVRNLSLEIPDQQFLVLVGPSGCGKSTTLRMVAGLEDLNEGQIFIDEKMVNFLPPKARDIAMVFQNYALYPHMTVYGNMAFGLRLRKMKRKEIDDRVREAARMLELVEYLDRKPRELSGGQRQRVAVGRAIVRKPKVFLFDEPLSNLDAKLRAQMRTELSRLHSRLRTTSIYVTHDQLEAMTLGDRIAVMNNGELQQTGTPMEVYDRPANLFVAGFIGAPQMNFFNGKISGQKFSGGGISLPLPGTLLDMVNGADGREVVLGLRPESICCQSHAPAATPGPEGNGLPNQMSVDALVEVVEPVGAETIVIGKIGSNPFTAKLPPSVNALPGQSLQLVLDLSKARLFDAISAEAIK